MTIRVHAADSRKNIQCGNSSIPTRDGTPHCKAPSERLIQLHLLSTSLHDSIPNANSNGTTEKADSKSRKQEWHSGRSADWNGRRLNGRQQGGLHCPIIETLPANDLAIFIRYAITQIDILNVFASDLGVGGHPM